MKAHSRSDRPAFTLIELLVVVAIIALLISILVPALGKARDQSKHAVCKSNLRQLALAAAYYADDNRDRLPYILGSPNSQGEPTIAPFYQYHQLFNFWPYLQDRKIFKCPMAMGDNSVKIYQSPGYAYASYYTVFKADERYLLAYRENWWPEINPTDYPGALIPPLYTEYWFNDWSWSASMGGQPIPQISGGLVSKIPNPQYAVVLSDGVWETMHPRHGNSNQFAFLDCHVDRVPRLRYLDPLGLRPDHTPTDYDAFGNRPFYAWGLTREGFNALP